MRSCARPDGFPPGSLLRINPGRKPEWKTDELSYGEFSELLRTARKLITGVRGIDADDLNPPERSTDFSVDVVELEKRAAGAEQSLRRTPDDFQAQLATPDTANLEVLRELIMRSAVSAWPAPCRFPLPAIRPPTARRCSRRPAQSKRSSPSASNNSTALAAGFDAGTATAEEQARSRTGAAAHRLRQSVRRAAAFYARRTLQELEKALADSAKVQDGDPFASTTWFQRMARVRDGVARLNACAQLCRSA